MGIGWQILPAAFTEEKGTIYFLGIPRVSVLLFLFTALFLPRPVWAIRDLTWVPSGSYDWKNSTNWDGPSGQFPDDDEDKAIFPTKGAIGDPFLDNDLSGTGGGDIDANVYVAPGGFIDRGLALDFLSVMGDVEIDGTFKVGLDPAKMGVPDRLYVDGDLDITQATVDFNALGMLDDEAYVFAWYDTLTGSQFANVLHLPTGYHIDNEYMGHNEIALVIPEPVSLLLLAAGCAGLLRRRNRLI